MKLQNIQGRDVYVVVLTEFPLPFPIHDGGDPELTPYAEALTLAITRGTITGPGKYGIEIDASKTHYDIWKINE